MPAADRLSVPLVEERPFSSLPRDFYDRPTLKVARELLGKHLVVRRGGRRVSGRIVETEAYIGEADRACHARNGKTARSAVLYGPPGHAYVYLVYGMHYLFNVVCEREGFPAAVLLRALEPDPTVTLRTDGPGKLTRALGIDLHDNRIDLCDGGGDFTIEDRGGPRVKAAATRRIGVDYAGEWAERPWRFVDPKSAWLSKKLKPGDVR